MRDYSRLGVRLLIGGLGLAACYAAIGHIRLGAQPPVFLKRDQAGWKVDLTATRQDPEHSPERIEQYLRAGRSLTRCAQDIGKGRYRTFDEAQAAIGDAASP